MSFTVKARVKRERKARVIETAKGTVGEVTHETSMHRLNNTSGRDT